jgi:hypothetical protein
MHPDNSDFRYDQILSVKGLIDRHSCANEDGFVDIGLCNCLTCFS